MGGAAHALKVGWVGGAGRLHGLAGFPIPPNTATPHPTPRSWLFLRHAVPAFTPPPPTRPLITTPLCSWTAAPRAWPSTFGKGMPACLAQSTCPPCPPPTLRPPHPAPPPLSAAGRPPRLRGCLLWGGRCQRGGLPCSPELCRHPLSPRDIHLPQQRLVGGWAPAAANSDACVHARASAVTPHPPPVNAHPPRICRNNGWWVGGGGGAAAAHSDACMHAFAAAAAPHHPLVIAASAPHSLSYASPHRTPPPTHPPAPTSAAGPSAPQPPSSTGAMASLGEGPPTALPPSE